MNIRNDHIFMHKYSNILQNCHDITTYPRKEGLFEHFCFENTIHWHCCDKWNRSVLVIFLGLFVFSFYICSFFFFFSGCLFYVMRMADAKGFSFIALKSRTDKKNDIFPLRIGFLCWHLFFSGTMKYFSLILLPLATSWYLKREASPWSHSTAAEMTEHCYLYEQFSRVISHNDKNGFVCSSNTRFTSG